MKKIIYILMFVLLFYSVNSQIYTENSKTVCENNKCIVDYSLNSRFGLNNNGEWVNIGELYDISRNEDDIIFNYNGYYGEYSIIFEAGVIYNQNYYSFSEIKQLYPQINYDFPIVSNEYFKKYAVNISNIPSNLISNIQNITLTYKNHTGFNINQLRSKTGKLIVNDIIGLYFYDLVISNYSINMDLQDRIIYISNLQDKFINNGLFLDPLISYSVGSSSDDAFEDEAGSVVTNMGQSASLDTLNRYVGFRFLNVTIPDSAIITDSKVQIYVFHSALDEPNITIYAQDSDNPSTFTSDVNNISLRVSTTNTKEWFSTDLGAPNYFNSTNISDVIQELTDNYDYSTGKNIVIIFSSNGIATQDLSIYFYDQSPIYAPKLFIEYELQTNQTNETTLDLYTNLINNTVDLSFINPLFITYNGTFQNENTSIVNCSLFVNNNLQTTDLNTNITILQNFTYSIGANGEYNFSIDCSNLYVNSTTGFYYYTIALDSTSNNATVSLNLTAIENQLNEIIEGVNMVGLIIFLAVFVGLGVWTRFYYLWFISALSSMVMSAIYFNNYVNDVTSVFYKSMAWFMLGVTVILIILALFLQNMFKKTTAKETIYDNFY